MFGLLVIAAIFFLAIGLTSFIMALRDADHWLHRRFNPNKKYADQGFSTEMADPEELQEITAGKTPCRPSTNSGSRVSWWARMEILPLIRPNC